MRMSVLAALILIASIGISVSWSHKVAADRGKSVLNTFAEKNNLVTLASTEQQTNVTTHVGDIVLSGNDVMVIKDARYELNGSLLMSGNSTLILDNSTLYPAFERWQHSFTLRDNARIIMERGSNIVSGLYDLYIYDNALINITDSTLEKSVHGWPSSRIQIFNSNVSQVALASDFRGSSSLLMINSSGTVGVYGNTEIINSTLDALAVAGDARVVNSTIGSLEVRGGSVPNGGYFGPYVKCFLINSTYGALDKSVFYSGAIYVEWYLTVAVESEGQPVESANVQVYYSHDGSLAAQQLTTRSGQVRFELPELKITEVGSLSLGNYTVKTNYGTATAEANVTLTASKDVTVELPKEPEPFPTVLFIAAGAVAIALGAIVYVRKKRATKQSA